MSSGRNSNKYPNRKYPNDIHENLPKVLHFGPQGDEPGGMAQVINAYLRWPFNEVEVRGVRTTYGKRKLFRDLPRYAACISAIIKARLSRGRQLLVFHMSQRGSFVREGSLVSVAHKLGLIVAIQLHGSEFPQHARRFPRSTAWTLSQADAVFSLTDETTRLVEEMADKRHPTSIFKFANAVAIRDDVAQTKRRQAIVMAGELGHRKGVDIALAAWETLGPLTAGWVLQLVGPRSEQIVDWPVLPRLEYIGVEPHEQLIERLHQSRIALLPARNEAMPMFLLEAMASGCAIITTPVGQITQIVDSSNGIVVPVDDYQAVADAIYHLILTPSLVHNMSQNGLQRIRSTYSSTAMVERLQSAWISLIEPVIEGSSDARGF